MTISKTLRFEIFKRDGFKCGYCGRTPPTVTLEIDHINPKANDGTNDINNLISACFDCNRGKKHITLDKIPPSLKENLKVLQEKEKQVEAYNKFLAKIRIREEEEAAVVDAIYTHYFPKYSLSDNFKETSLRRFVQLLPVEVVKNAMHTACSRRLDQERSIRYFCGICWKEVKQSNEVSNA